MPAYRRYMITFHINFPEAATFVNAWAKGEFGTPTKAKASVRFFCGQVEVAPTTGALHLQAYLELDAKVSIAPSLQEILGTKKFKALKCNGTSDDNRAYCSKDESRACKLLTEKLGLPFGPFEFGEPAVAKQGARTDLDALAALVNAGHTPDQIAMMEGYSGMYMRYARNIRLFWEARQRHLARTTARQPCRVITLWGAARTGKSRFVAENTEAKETFRLTQANVTSRMWFDNYEGEKNLWFDDFRGSWCKPAELLTILDRYHMSMSNKGGTGQAAWTTVYITSNINPGKWYKRIDKETKFAIYGRLTEGESYIKEFKRALVAPPVLPSGWSSDEEEEYGARRAFGSR